MTHLQKYGKTYLFGALFVLVTVAEGFVGEFQNVAPDAVAHWTRLQWAVAIANVAITAGTTLLAFLNPTYSKTSQPPSP